MLSGNSPRSGRWFQVGVCDGHSVLSATKADIDRLRQPNLQPPITTTEQAIAYRAVLTEIDPQTTYLMTLYLSPDLTTTEIRKAKGAGIVGSFPLFSHLCLRLKSYQASSLTLVA